MIRQRALDGPFIIFEKNKKKKKTNIAGLRGFRFSKISRWGFAFNCWVRMGLMDGLRRMAVIRGICGGGDLLGLVIDEEGLSYEALELKEIRDKAQIKKGNYLLPRSLV